MRPEDQKIIDEEYARMRRLDAARYAISQPAPDVKYNELRRILDLAYSQSASGKGRERHANEQPWPEQPIFTVTRSKGLGFPAGQADKKITEALGMFARNQHDAAIAECLGAIVYTAALIRRIEELRDQDQ